MGEKSASPDEIVARIARRQHGVVSTRQLLAAGMHRNAVSGRLRKGRLHQVYRGVHAVGHAGISREGKWMAAVLACGNGVIATEERTILGQWGAALSHRSAAELWGLLPPSDGPVHVSIPGDGGRRRRQGIRLHRCSTLLPAAVTRHNAIPVTKPARTIADLRRTVGKRGGSGIVAPKELRRAIRQADVLGLPLGPDPISDRTRSDLERLFLRLCRAHGLPEPEVNVRIGSMLVDFLWRDHQLVVETDGYRYHRGRTAFEDDRSRDLELRTLGYEVLRLSYRQVADEPQRIAAVLRATLTTSARQTGS
jgi:very-short-patch-repair endonuclease